MTTIDVMMERIVRGTTEIISPDNLRQKLTEAAQTGRPLCIKAGFDPTAPDIHLGHVVLLRKLRQFQDMGHRVFFLIGDFTAQIGDPTGRDQLRPRMEEKTIRENAATYEKQVLKVLDPAKTEVVFNSQWLSPFMAKDFLALMTRSTVAQMLARADFKKRFEEGKEISLLEFAYPLLQGYDSVHLKADIELGGSDQKFNLLMGRQMQESYGQAPQVVIMTPLLEGLDGIKKMSKSLNNYIGIDEPPETIMGKVMSVSDELMFRYYEVLTEVPLAEVKAMHPKEAKLRLGQAIIRLFYDDKAATEAKEEFDRVFSQGQIPDDVVEYKLPDNPAEGLLDILLKTKMVASRNEGRRLLGQGGVTHEGARITDEHWPVARGVLKVGKRRFLRVI